MLLGAVKDVTTSIAPPSFLPKKREEGRAYNRSPPPCFYAFAPCGTVKQQRNVHRKKRRGKNLFSFSAAPGRKAIPPHRKRGAFASYSFLSFPFLSRANCCLFYTSSPTLSSPIPTHEREMRDKKRWLFIPGEGGGKREKGGGVGE